MNYRKKPVVIQALQWTGDNHAEIQDFAGKEVQFFATELIVKTLEGELRASPQDWIIKGTHGEFYPIKPDIFSENYEPEP